MTEYDDEFIHMSNHVAVKQRYNAYINYTTTLGERGGEFMKCI